MSLKYNVRVKYICSSIIDSITFGATYSMKRRLTLSWIVKNCNTKNKMLIAVFLMKNV